MNDNEVLSQLQNKADAELFDFDDLEKRIEEQLSEHLQDLEDLEEESRKIEAPEELGNAVLSVVWEQFINQVGVVAGEDFIAENRGLKLDLRDEAHIQTTENFSKGKIATHNDKIDYQQRYDEWQNRFEKDDSGRILTHSTRTGKEVERVKKEARRPFDKDRPKGSSNNHTDMDHTVSAAEIIRDPEANAHLSIEKQIEFANSKENLNEIDSAMNRSKSDLSMEDWLDTPNTTNKQKPNEIFDIDEKTDQKLREKDKEARTAYQKKKEEGVKESIRTGRQSQKEEAFRIGGKALRSMIMSLLADLIRNIVGKLIVWLQSKARSFNTFIEHIKDAIISLAVNVQRHILTAGNSLINTIATAMIGPVVNTIRKVWTAIKQGARSVKEAMFIISYSTLRHKIIKSKSFINMLHLGRGIFGSDFGTTAFVIQNSEIRCIKSKFYKLYLRQGEVDSVEEKERMFFDRIGEYISSQDSFIAIPDSPIAYWASHALLKDFECGSLVSQYAAPKQGMSTCDVNRFSKLWYEVSICDTNIYSPNNIGKWVKYNKGGNFRKWYGNREFLVFWGKDGSTLIANGALLRNKDVYFQPFLAWTKISSAGTGFRIFEDCFLFDGAGGSLFNKHNGIEDNYLLGLLNSKVSTLILNLISPTLNYNENHIGSIPIILCNNESTSQQIKTLVDAAVILSQNDWDSFETSWDFQQHPLVHLKPKELHELRVYGVPGSGYEPGNEIHAGTIEQAYMAWWHEADERFSQLKANEEELNRIFIDIYGLQDELTPDVDGKDVTVRKADLGRDIRSLISYAVGCMLGRYSLDKPGLAFAGGEWDESQYVTYHADHDGILPITDDEYFDDDIVGKFIEWVRTIYGAETLEANLKYIAEALGGKGNPREVIRQYFLNDFYKDHLKIYQKRPIYWLFDSGKKNGFKCLIYMHRYQPDTIARIRTDYLHETQARYRNAIETLERQSANASTGERVKMTKRLNALKAQAEEARVYEEKIHHLADQMIKIDLDDGVKVNYAKFQDVLAPIK
ncbi:MAG: BREX-1 system adenine-specific DNA-methyltransferase PglX [Clostridia bacterium]|nr:BREX-1 system adenine-specific DNA-methyltransferase PglX [Clostridia bacterium]